MSNIGNIEITQRLIDHHDPDAAGFTQGWWWRVETPLGVFESGAATKAEAQAAAEAAAGPYRPTPGLP